jgi:hypothetical protein
MVLCNEEQTSGIQRWELLRIPEQMLTGEEQTILLSPQGFELLFIGCLILYIE